ncbi:glutaredoxin-C9-like [Olea europaea var. sylvestris]|uniref:glutaredoxin-C9-like n=1 Tax=Olea europaea var. sylvestris TaxID=158386 RepID=UPI000C1D2947|nr:glutaredoxin-C9-like [Olea europaea var. sylvestris]
MQQALPYINLPFTTTSNGGATTTAVEVPKLVAENAVVIFARSGCCMCHVVKLLLHGHGVNPTIFDIDEQNEASVTGELSKIIGIGEAKAAGRPQFPAVFVGGKLFGGLEEVMAAHISGELVPMLRKARALWL